jgi:hypothetical protein
MSAQLLQFKQWRRRCVENFRKFGSFSSPISPLLQRLACQSLPTGDVRHHQNMAMSSLCFICGAEGSWRHSLIECTILCCVWALANEETTQHMSILAKLTTKQWIFLMMEMLDHTFKFVMHDAG